MPVVSPVCYVDAVKWPSIARYQNPKTIGHTDSEQRWYDAKQCGAININKDTSDYDYRGIISDLSEYSGEVMFEKIKHNRKVWGNFEECMMKKGYKIFRPGDCGYQNKKWDTGKCNL